MRLKGFAAALVHVHISFNNDLCKKERYWVQQRQQHFSMMRPVGLKIWERGRYAREQVQMHPTRSM